MNRWTNAVQSIYTYSGIILSHKRNGVLLAAEIGTNISNIMLSQEASSKPLTIDHLEIFIVEENIKCKIKIPGEG